MNKKREPYDKIAVGERIRRKRIQLGLSQDELAVRILQHRAHMGRKLKNAAVGRIHTVYRQAAGAFAGVGKRVQPVDAGRQRAFAAAGRPGDQHTLTGVDIQVDIMQRRLFLRTILEGEVFE